ncbi:hypothetical protein DSAG12_01697 [Promethearchaeum syntrophicum]|uniref:Uncharacterized protein n=1 Tax=Promethearchaeum syntrophicum TaxID=2594042 RepID=A0A5B9DAR9_9ARCH|nr:hypothetical protein [Candidatus Prometheoarchaeum syntrophicum]QEE15870.1 V-type ATP synthase subunit E [Candidatus Prometheoarchaeum syntrophicum]
MSLREDFKDVAYDLARIINKEIEVLQKRKESSISYIKETTLDKTERDLLKLEKKLIKKTQTKLNIEESKRISKINQKISQKKTECVDNFIELLQKEIIRRIEKDPDKYFSFLKRKIIELLPLVNIASNIYINSKDLKYLKKNSIYKLLPEKRDILKLSDNPIETLFGFKIIDRHNTLCIDYTFESLIMKHKQEISIEFMKIFPIFEVNVKNATEIFHQKHPEVKDIE